MPLVSYSSSSENSASELPVPRERNNALKRKRPQKTQTTPANAAAVQPALPSLPASFHDLYTSAARVSTHDDPSLHGGRKRALPHVEGQWPSHVFLEWLPSPSETAQLNKLLTKTATSSLKSTWTSLVTSPLGVLLPLHISLSAPLSLATDQRGPFLASLRSGITRNGPNLRPFSVTFDTSKWFPNEERTRWFLVLGIRKPHGNELNSLLKACNKVARQYGMKELYPGTHSKGEEDHTSFFHFSIAWSLTDPSTQGISKEAESISALAGFREMHVKLDTVKVKIGDAVTSLALGGSVQ